MFVVALKRAGFAVSWSRIALWEIPTGSFSDTLLHEVNVE
jgi:hypothetical protein